MAEFEILTQRENKLLNRIEINFCIRHEGEPTPKRDDVRSFIAAAVKSPKDNVIIDHMRTKFGRTETIGYAKVYSSVEAAKNIEPLPILKRNGVIKEGKNEGG